MEKTEIQYLIIAGTIILLVLGIFIITLLWNYYRINSNYRNKLLLAEQQKQKEILKTQLEIQEQTFNTISREIHDNVGQVLSLAKVQLNIIDQSESFNKTLVTDAKESVSKAMTDLRDIAKSLNSERIKVSSLPEITEYELQRINRSGIMLTSIKVEGQEQYVQEDKKLIIFRIIQEGLHNILKHSKAKNIDIIFCYHSENLLINIIDNGIGFEKELLTKKDGLGLQNIISRAALIGGKAVIDSVVNRGTTISIISPYV